MKRWVFTGLAGLLLIGCSHAAPGAPPAPSPAPAPAPPESPPAVKIPAEPFWGPPGTTVLTEDGQVLSESLKPLPFMGRLLQPVMAEQTTYLLHAGEGGLWLDGTMYPMIGQLNLDSQPAHLASLPYAIGDTWAFWGEGRGPQIKGFEAVETPAGTFPAILIEEPDSGQRQWWSPGVGLVKRQLGDRTLVAERIERREPAMLSKAQQVAPDLTAIITAGGVVLDQTGRVMADFGYDKNSGRRPSDNWDERLGVPYPVVQHGTHSQASPNWKVTYWIYEPDTRTFQPLPWVFPDGSRRTELVGTVDTQGSQITFRDNEAYPFTQCTFHHKDGAMRATDCEITYADTEFRFAAQLSRPLNHRSFVGLFADAATGERAFAWAYRGGRNLLTDRTPKVQADATWVAESPGANARFKLHPQGKDYRIIEWSTAP